MGATYLEKYSNIIGKFPKANRCLNGLACKIYNSTTTCERGHKGFICADCIEGYYMNGVVCTVCPGQKQAIINISIAIVLVVVLITAVIFLVLFKSNKDELNKILSNIKIAMNYFYFSSKMYDIMTFIDWPDKMMVFIGFLKRLEFNPIVILSITCWTKRFSLYEEYLFFVFVNLFVVAMTATGFSTLRVAYYFGLITNNCSKKYRKLFVAFSSMSIFLLYTPTSIAIVQLLPVACKDYYLSFPDSFKVSYFMQEPATKCFTDYHKKWLNCVYVSLLYVFGIPICIPFFIWYLRRSFTRKAKIYLPQTINDSKESVQEHRIPVPLNDCIPDIEDKIQENSSIARDIYDGLEFYYGNYKEKYFFWESLEMVKKLFLASIAVFIGESSYTFFALLIMFSGVFAVLHAHFQPITSQLEHFLQLICLSALHSHLLLGLSMKTESDWFHSDPKQDREALSVSLIICHTIVVLLIFGKHHYQI